MTGKGIIYSKKGDKYEGTFLKGKLEGLGIIYYHEGSKISKLEAEFVKGEQKGKTNFLLS